MQLLFIAQVEECLVLGLLEKGEGFDYLGECGGFRGGGEVFVNSQVSAPQCWVREWRKIWKASIILSELCSALSKTR